MTPAQLLKKTRALIDTPEKWLRGNLAQSAHGNRCHYNQPQARTFCLMGAFMKFADKEACEVDEKAKKHLRNAASSFGPGGSIMDFNDNPRTTHANVLTALDLAIEAALKEEGTK